MRSRCTGRDLLTKFSHEIAEDVAADGGWYVLVFAAPHCHTPACELMELWDEDRGELLCRGVPIYGGGSGKAHDELGYVVSIPPCVWGSREEGLLPPPRLHLRSNLSSFVRVNATRTHPGSMGLWQMRVARIGPSSNTEDAMHSPRQARVRAAAVDRFVVH
jgi:hypothetical protein